jgi:adenylate cyclase
VQRFDIFNKDPIQFARFHRYLSYVLVITVIVVGVGIKFPIQNPFLLIFILLTSAIIQNEFFSGITRQHGYAVTKNVTLSLDTIVMTLCLVSMGLVIIPSTVLIVGLFFSAIWNRTSLLNMIANVLLALISFYLFSYLLGREQYWHSQNSIALSVVSVLCLVVYLGLRLVYYHYRVQSLTHDKKYLEEQVNKYLTLSNKLARYAPSQIWQSIIRGEQEAKIDNKRKKLTIFFSDIQGFTELSEKLLPDDLAFILNEYFEHMSELARKFGGTVDKFMGDAILIFFGDPDTKGAKEDAIACIDMAIAMRQQMKVLRQRWQNIGYDGLHIRIGVTTGYCHVGNFGTTSRMSYTIVGRDANLAARLQTAAEVDQILISEDTYQLIKDSFVCHSNGDLILKGLSGPVATWQVLEKQDQVEREASRWIDYELDGFNVQLNLDEMKFYESEKALHLLEQASKRLKTEIMKRELEQKHYDPSMDR